VTWPQAVSISVIALSTALTLTAIFGKKDKSDK